MLILTHNKIFQFRDIRFLFFEAEHYEVQCNNKSHCKHSYWSPDSEHPTTINSVRICGFGVCTGLQKLADDHPTKFIVFVWDVSQIS